nr:MAG TPA: hypothetical protein [Caudoviricetes sp.]
MKRVVILSFNNEVNPPCGRLLFLLVLYGIY